VSVELEIATHESLWCSEDPFCGFTSEGQKSQNVQFLLVWKDLSRTLGYFYFKRIEYQFMNKNYAFIGMKIAIKNLSCNFTVK
jgi:hypothetical protein